MWLRGVLGYSTKKVLKSWYALLERDLIQILGIDLNPSACVAARCNLVLQISKLKRDLIEPVSLNILNADSIAPSIIKGQLSATGMEQKSNQISVDGSMLPITKNVLSDLGRHTDVLSEYGLQLTNWSLRLPTHNIKAAEVTSRVQTNYRTVISFKY